MDIDELFDQAIIEHKQKQEAALRAKEQRNREEEEARQLRRSEIDEICKSAEETLKKITKVCPGEKFRNYLADLFKRKGSKHYRSRGGLETKMRETCDYYFCVPRQKTQDEAGETENYSLELVIIWNEDEDISKAHLEIRTRKFRHGIVDYDYPFGPSLEQSFYPYDSYKEVLLVLSDPEKAIKFFAEQL